MSRMPGAQWFPKDVGARAKRRKGRAVVLHVAVSEAQNLRPGADADWHFYVAKDGAIYQYIDTDLQSWATGAANASVISVETQGGVKNADSEPWTDAQVRSLARLCRWAHDDEGVPLQVMADSKPASRGIGWHKLGVKPWVAAGGEVWSSSAGKICPGAAKIAQIPQIVALAAGGATVQAQEEDDMYEDTDRKDAQATKVGVTWALVPENGFNSQGEVTKRIRDIHAQVTGLNGALTALAKLVAEQNGLSLDDVRQVVSEEVAKGVDIDVTVNGTAA